MGLTQLSAHGTVLVLIAYLALVLFGILTYVSLDLKRTPTLERPIVTVQTVYSGASAQAVDGQVTRHLDVVIAGLGNIKRLSSLSRSGRASLPVYLREELDPDVAVSDIQHWASAVERDLPADANPAHGGVRHMGDKRCQKR